MATTTMVRFRYDRAQTIRAGMNCSTPAVAWLELDMGLLTQEQREMIARRICDDGTIAESEFRNDLGWNNRSGQVWYKLKGDRGTLGTDREEWVRDEKFDPSCIYRPILAKLPTVESLCEAIAVSEAAIANGPAIIEQEQYVKLKSQAEADIAALADYFARPQARAINAEQLYAFIGPRLDFDIRQQSWAPSGYIRVWEGGWKRIGRPSLRIACYPGESGKHLDHPDVARATEAAREVDEHASRINAAAKAEAYRLATEACTDFVNEVRTWVAQHGSFRLVRLLAEGLPCQDTYRKERDKYESDEFTAALAEAHPGWTECNRNAGVTYDFKDVSIKTLNMLDAGRRMIRTCKLAWNPNLHKYVCTAEFRGRLICWSPATE